MEEIRERNQKLIQAHLELQEKTEEDRKRFYRLIRRLAKIGITQKMLAYYCGCSRQTINKIIHKKCK